MLIDLAKMAKIHKFGSANSLLDSPMGTHVANQNGNPELLLSTLCKGCVHKFSFFLDHVFQNPREKITRKNALYKIN